VSDWAIDLFGTISVNFWDFALLGVVSLQVTAMAYLPRARWKALAMALPFPFTTIALSQGSTVNATHVLALLGLLSYYHAVRLLHLRLPIVPAIFLGLSLYIGLSQVLLALVPSLPFWPSVFGVASLACGLFLWQPPRNEPNHRTPLPVYFKLPAAAAIIALLLVLKGSLQGFATLFPILGVVGLYEARKGLWSICRQAPAFIMGMCAMLVVIYSTQEALGLRRALLVGWVAYLALLWPMTRRLWKREKAHYEQENSPS
jgi:hypothetical protein